MQEKNIRVLEWNLNFGSYDDVVPAGFIGEYIKGFDVVILTEVRANNVLINMIETWGYDYIASDDQGKFFNQIVIMAKKKYKLKRIAGKLISTNGELGPDFLHGIIKVGKKKINLLGVRIKTSGYAERFRQAKLINTYISSIEGSIICAGDFNSGQIRGLDDSNYSDVKTLYKYRSRSKELSDLRFYNFHLIKNLIGERFILKETMGEDNSWGLTENKGNLVYGFGKRVKNDLLFYSSDIKGNSNYSWEHVRQNKQEYLDMIVKNCKKCGNKVEHGYPDHARLVAELAV
ncbi:MAG: endonuclease/exonuclease/phosphatase family protein [Butyrivibrio sp.]